MPESKPDYTKIVSLVIGAVGLLTGVAGGLVVITTPKEQQCQIDLADARARLELYTQAGEACKDALDACGKH